MSLPQLTELIDSRLATTEDDLERTYLQEKKSLLWSGHDELSEDAKRSVIIHMFNELKP